MKKLYLSCLILLSFVSVTLQAKITDPCCLVDCIPKDSCDCEITSRSYLAVRPQFQSASPEMVSGFRSDRTSNRENGQNGALQIVPFGGKSTNDDDLARYFFFGCKTVLTVDERIGSGLDTADGQPPLKPQDLLAQHFNIFTIDGNFRSQIGIAPEQQVVGAGVEWRQRFCQNEEAGRGFYSSISFPIERVKNKLHFTENVISDGGGVDENENDEVVANMKEAFNQPAWNFGKISSDCCDQSKTGVADIEAKIGYEWLEHEPCHLETYLGIKIPTGNKPTGEYLFEPIVGNGRHWGIMIGNAIGVQIWKDEAKDRSLRVEYNNNTQYLFRNTQCRSLDLVCKPWSRYIQTYRSFEEAQIASAFPAQGESNASNIQVNFSTPGINVLTIPLSVRPGFSHNGNGALVFNTKRVQIEGGYNLYCRQSECVKLPCPWVEGPAIKARQGAGTTNPVRDITGNFRLESFIPANQANVLMQLQDYKFNMIKEEDLNIQSAVSPCLISHTLYGTVGYNWDDRNYPLFALLGGSYEFSNSNNAVVERWLVWAKLGVSY